MTETQNICDCKDASLNGACPGLGLTSCARKGWTRLCRAQSSRMARLGQVELKNFQSILKAFAPVKQWSSLIQPDCIIFIQGHNLQLARVIFWRKSYTGYGTYFFISMWRTPHKAYFASPYLRVDMIVFLVSGGRVCNGRSNNDHICPLCC